MYNIMCILIETYVLLLASLLLVHLMTDVTINDRIVQK